MTRATSTSPEAWAAKYRDSRPQYDKLAKKFEELVTKVLETEGYEVIQISSRTKTVQSFLAKLERKKDKYGDPLKEVTDLAGIRVVTYYVEDVQNVVDLFRPHFTVDERRSVVKGGEEPDKFGYQSTHLIVTVSEARKKFPEWSEFAGMWAEIQIRTATQHAWAAVEHKLGYKNPANVPPALARQLYCLSALFELADVQFSQVRDSMDDLQDQFAKKLIAGELDLSVDVSSVEAYLRNSSVATRAVEVAEVAGWKAQSDASLADPRRRERDLGDLAESLIKLGISKIKDFDELLSRVDSVADALEEVAAQERNDISGGAHPDAEAFPEDLLTVVVFLIARAPPEIVESVYGGVTAQAIQDAIENAAPATSGVD